MKTSRKFLIADSGGTKTDWCFIDSTGERSFFTTESYHPVNWNESFRIRMRDYFQEFPGFKSAEVHFFGAGCLKKELAEDLEKMFYEVGFKSVSIKSDLHAAGLACLGNETGWVAICGTGSVLFDWNQGAIGKIIGGKGHLEGDQGSGFYFGKLVFEAYEFGQLSSFQRELFEQNCQPAIINQELLKGNFKFTFANISYQLKSHQNDFKSYHLLNISSFYENHLAKMTDTVIHFSGSYVWSNENLFRDVFEDKTCKIGIVRHRPIMHIIDQMVSMID